MLFRVSYVSIVLLICFLIFTSSIYATIEQVQKTYTENQNSTSISANYTSTPIEGNLLIAIIGNRSSDAPPSTPSGWTLIDEATGNSPGQAIYYRIAGSSEPTAISFSGFDEVSNRGMHLYEYSGVDTASPLAASYGFGGTGTSVSTGMITTSKDSSLIIVGFTNNATGNFNNWTNGFTEQVDFTNGGESTSRSIYASADLITGATGDYSTSATKSSGDWYGHAAVFNPAEIFEVTTELDSLDGDTTSIDNLLSDKGVDGYISLREAIIACNNTAGLDTINFAIGTGLKTITLSSALPEISDSVVIDGSSQPGFVNIPLIELDGNSAGSNVDGLSLNNGSDGSTIRSLIIKRFDQDGILIQNGANNVTVAGCWIGVDTSGLISMGNGDDGIEIYGASNTIGGSNSTDRNIINNNTDEGINITGSSAIGNVIINNFIGLDPDGSSGSGNTDVGIAIVADADSTIVGGITSNLRNVISMNLEGIEINSDYNIVKGNYIGTDSTGLLNRGNRGDDGVEVQSNAINNTIGGTEAGAGNVIAFNDLAGVNIFTGTGNSILGNNVHSNSGLGINLGLGGVQNNDLDDTDSGANNLQNYPVLDSANSNGVDSIIIYGSLNSRPDSSFRLEFFSNSNVDETGYGEGETFIGDTTVTTDGSGDVSYSVTILESVAGGKFITATATDANNNSSEFSDTISVVETINISVDVSNSSFSFGTGLLNTVMTPQVSVITNDGNTAEDFIVQISQFTDGTYNWDIGETSNGADSIRAQWSTASSSGPWTDISAYASDFTIATAVAVDDSVIFWFRILTPTSTTSFNEYSSTMTITAEEF